MVGREKEDCLAHRFSIDIIHKIQAQPFIYNQFVLKNLNECITNLLLPITNACPCVTVLVSHVQGLTPIHMNLYQTLLDSWVSIKVAPQLNQCMVYFKGVHALNPCLLYLNHRIIAKFQGMHQRNQMELVARYA